MTGAGVATASFLALGHATKAATEPKVKIESLTVSNRLNNRFRYTYDMRWNLFSKDSISCTHCILVDVIELSGVEGSVH